ncbi:MAG: copper amine oxidase N-terminal domain-containing protein, partial [Caldiserica bacterium]|nr:copper amine oxidase N-terminal domain-containing protein [Caldisericota bacterium]
MNIFRKFMIFIGIVVLVSTLGYSGNSNAADPTFKLSAKGGCGYVVLAWDSFPNADGYWIYRGFASGKEFEMPLTDFPIKALEFKDENDIENDTQYCYIVKAVNAAGDIIATSNETCVKSECTQEDAESDVPQTNCKLELRFIVGEITYWVNGTAKGKLSTAPELIQSRVSLPIRKMCDEIGASLVWDDTTKTAIVIAADGTKLELQIGNPMAKLNGVSAQIDPNNKKVVPYISKGNT